MRRPRPSTPHSEFHPTSSTVRRAAAAIACLCCALTAGCHLTGVVADTVDEQDAFGHRQTLIDTMPSGDDGPRPGSSADPVAGGCSQFPTNSSPRQYTFQDDRQQILPRLREDAAGVVNWNNAAILGVALGATIGIRQDLDGEVRDATARHPERWGETSHVLGKFGEVQYQVPLLLALYGYSLKQQDQELHELSRSLISAYTLTAVSAVATKVIANTDRPSETWNGGQFGFPSFHTSTSFSIAAVLDEYYGPKAGIPAYTVAGLIGWSRIDERDHDLSDVLFGAALGYVIGKSVAGGQLYGDSRVRLLPYVHPTDGTSGLMLDVSF